MDWPTVVASCVPVAAALAGGLRGVALPIIKLANAAERIAVRLEGADYVALPRANDRTDDVLSLEARRHGK